MANAQVPQEKIPDRQPFNPAQGPPPVTDALNPAPQAYLIEKCVKQLVKKGLFGRPYVQDFLYEQKRRNCRMVWGADFLEDQQGIHNGISEIMR